MVLRPRSKGERLPGNWWEAACLPLPRKPENDSCVPARGGPHADRTPRFDLPGLAWTSSPGQAVSLAACAVWCLSHSRARGKWNAHRTMLHFAGWAIESRIAAPPAGAGTRLD